MLQCEMAFFLLLTLEIESTFTFRASNFHFPSIMQPSKLEQKKKNRSQHHHLIVSDDGDGIKVETELTKSFNYADVAAAAAASGKKKMAAVVVLLLHTTYIRTPHQICNNWQLPPWVSGPLYSRIIIFHSTPFFRDAQSTNGRL